MSEPLTETIRVGGVSILLTDALAFAGKYLTSTDETWAYPAYDSYERGHDLHWLSDADLLAPILLNVKWMSLDAYYSLQRVRGRLEETLRRIPITRAIEDDGATSDIGLVGDLFSVLDTHDLKGVRGTILAKVLHRKRPAFIPLYDENIHYCYRDAPNAPIPEDPNRRWAQFMVLLAHAVREDLRSQLQTWDLIVNLAPGPRISRLRALDIVGWKAGRIRNHDPSVAGATSANSDDQPHV